MTAFQFEPARLGIGYATWDVMCWSFMFEMRRDAIALLRSFGEQ